jgi:RimJ/RimL family protein N-acetyltransferase
VASCLGSTVKFTEMDDVTWNIDPEAVRAGCRRGPRVASGDLEIAIDNWSDTPPVAATRLDIAFAGQVRRRNPKRGLTNSDHYPLGVRLREARSNDAELLFTWRNDPETRRQSRDTEAVDWEDHLEWLVKVLEAPDRLLLIAVDDQGPIGTIRFDFVDKRAEISVTVAPERRGEGLAASLVREGTQGVDAPVDAWIRSDNEISRRAFERAGFKLVDATEGWVRYVYS